MKVRIQCTKEKLDELIQAIKNDELEYSDNASFVLIEETVKKDMLLVFHGEEIIPVKLEEIIYFEAIQGKVLVHCEKGIFESKEPLYQLEGELKSSGFLRIHRSFIINRSKIERIRSAFNTKLILVMSNQDKVEVSRSYYNQFKKDIGF